MLRFAGILLLLSCSLVVLAISGQGQNEELIIALMAANDLKITYSEDGAADATVVSETPLPLIRKIVDLKEEAIPLLIEHLDDRRQLAGTFQTRKAAGKVIVGYVCLDILIQITESKNVHIEDCFDDGLGACLGPDYYFRPDNKNRNTLKKVKAAWLKAHQTGKVKFQYPNWLK